MSDLRSVLLTGIGIVLVNDGRATLQPSTHVVGQRLGLGYSAADTVEANRFRKHREMVEKLADSGCHDGQCEDPDGWLWLDHNGHPVDGYLR